MKFGKSLPTLVEGREHTHVPELQDDPSLFDYNVDERVDAFIKDILLQAGNLRTNNVMFTFGSDFQYESAIENYKNIDKLMEYTMQKVHVIVIESSRMYHSTIFSRY